MWAIIINVLQKYVMYFMGDIFLAAHWLSNGLAGTL